MLENIVNCCDHLKRCICQDNGIFLLEKLLSKDAESAGDIRSLASIEYSEALFNQINTNAQLTGDIPTVSGPNERPSDELQVE
ncbi:7921_t:CDS:2 [Gigaspora rosea]|nr:7921_t:CDS:2 [Gigaspora rosea]